MIGSLRGPSLFMPHSLPDHRARIGVGRTGEPPRGRRDGARPGCRFRPLWERGATPFIALKGKDRRADGQRSSSLSVTGTRTCPEAVPMTGTSR